MLPRPKQPKLISRPAKRLFPSRTTVPSDFDAEYSVTVDDKGSNFFQYNPKTRKVTWNKDAEAPSGTYQLVITDKNNNYVPIIAQINLNVYAYAAVPYDEYWKSEGVYLSGDNWKLRRV